jgi:hypothetical protein
LRTNIEAIRTDRPVEVARIARLDRAPRYQGSMHDDQAAQRFGFARAIVPGVYLFGFMTQLVMPVWGREWLTRGTIHSRSRRPVYDGDPLNVVATPIMRDVTALWVDLTVKEAGGIEVASGRATLPNDTPPEVDLASFPVLPVPATPPLVRAGEMSVGMRFSSVNAVVSEEDHRQSMDDFGETWPGFRVEGILHPGLLLRLSMRDTIASHTYTTPGIYVSSECQFLGLAHVGDRISSSGTVGAAYERKGHHYFESDQLLLANETRPIARIRRVSIYAARPELV